MIDWSEFEVDITCKLPLDIVEYLYNYKYTKLESKADYNYPFWPYFFIEFPKCDCCGFGLALFIDGDGSWYVLENSRGFDFTVGYLPNPIRNLEDLKLILDFYENNGRGYP